MQAKNILSPISGLYAYYSTIMTTFLRTKCVSDPLISVTEDENNDKISLTAPLSNKSCDCKLITEMQYNKLPFIGGSDL